MITVLHREGSSQMITVLHRGGPANYGKFLITTINNLAMSHGLDIPLPH